MWTLSNISPPPSHKISENGSSIDKNKTHLQLYNVRAPLERISMDIVGLFPKTNREIHWRVFHKVGRCHFCSRLRSYNNSQSFFDKIVFIFGTPSHWPKVKFWVFNKYTTCKESRKLEHSSHSSPIQWYGQERKIISYLHLFLKIKRTATNIFNC